MQTKLSLSKIKSSASLSSLGKQLDIVTRQKSTVDTRFHINRDKVKRVEKIFKVARANPQMYNTGVSNQDIATVDDVLPIFKLQKLR